MCVCGVGVVLVVCGGGGVVHCGGMWGAGVKSRDYLWEKIDATQWRLLFFFMALDWY